MKELDFEAIYERYHQALHRFCLSIVGNSEDAGDALQNTMVKALRSLPGEEREIQLKPWLYRVAHNESIELLRRRRDQVELDAQVVAPTSAPEEAAAMRERLHALIADLRELPERQRSALVMRELAGLEFAEIAEALDTSASVARQTVYEARLSLGQLKAGREMDCGKVQWELSGEDGRVARRRDIQAHLRECAECRVFRDAIDARRRDLGALAPLPAAASAGLLHAILAGGGAGGPGLGGTVGAGAGKVAASSVAVKSAATVAVVAAIAVPTADRAGLVHVGLFDRGTSQSRTTEQTPSAPGSPRASDAASHNRSTGGETSASQNRQGEPGLTGASPAGQSKNGGDASPAGSPPPAAATPSGASNELPAASNHGQETAASHGGGRDSARSHANGKAHSAGSGKHPAHGSPPSHGGGAPHEEQEQPPRPSRPPTDHPQKKVIPDNAHEQPLQPSQPPVNEGPPDEPGAQQRSKEAR
ncbi:MAG: sigma-70 family RNA polymerase sigma factor [Gemmatimonadales bacterium]